jgi:hypothetical protein
MSCTELPDRFPLLNSAEMIEHAFFHRYHLRATINHEHDHFTATILDSSNRIFLYNDLEGLQQIDQSPFYAETAIYVLKK